SEVVGLTTVAQPVAAQGREAARLLLARLDEPAAAPPGLRPNPAQLSSPQLSAVRPPSRPARLPFQPARPPSPPGSAP
ncbi:hypothetical protein ACWGR2_37950, partial [Streptomyces decoyicus]